MNLKNPNLEKYYLKGFESVEGWCSAQLFQTIDLLDSASLNKVGGACEIGVHHGKFFILLNQVISADQKSYAIDIFEQQSLNIDASGKGTSSKFKSNLQLYDVHGGSNTELIEGDSTDSALRSRIEKQIGAGAIRFFSIDGGHTAEHTINDLEIADKLTSNEGVVIVDDVLNSHWLGVIEGVTNYLSRYPTLVPFALGGNKLYLSKLSYQSFYFDFFKTSPLLSKVVRFFGHSIAVLK